MLLYLKSQGILIKLLQFSNIDLNQLLHEMGRYRTKLYKVKHPMPKYLFEDQNTLFFELFLGTYMKVSHRIVLIFNHSQNDSKTQNQ